VKSDMKHMMLRNHTYMFDQVFRDDCTNTDVFELEGRRVVDHVLDGVRTSTPAVGTIMLFGQTGSGKTYTISGLYGHVARELFRDLPAGTKVSMTHLEICGENVHDLYHGGEKRPVQLLTKSDGSVSAFPVTILDVCSEEDIIANIEKGLLRRESNATEMNSNSSRSHSIIQVSLVAPVGENVCTITLVDLAGSEMNGDSMHHNADRRNESKQIMMSLLALKECIRSKVISNSSNNEVLSSDDGSAPPTGESKTFNFRKSKLTMALKGPLSSKYGKTSLIATVSPLAKDTEHTLNTLRYVAMMNKSPYQEAVIEEGEAFLRRVGDNVDDEARDSVEVSSSKGLRRSRSTKDTRENSGTVDSKVLDMKKRSEGKLVSKVESDSEVLRLQGELAKEGLSQATMYGLKRQLALRKAAVRKEMKV
jgi:kinesin family protein 2/24